jgi:hypothetical protein
MTMTSTSLLYDFHIARIPTTSVTMVAVTGGDYILCTGASGFIAA